MSNGRGDLPPLDPMDGQGQSAGGQPEMKWPLRFTITVADKGTGFVISATRREEELVPTGATNGPPFAVRQRVVQTVAAGRHDVVEAFHEWCNGFSDLAVAVAREAEANGRSKN